MKEKIRLSPRANKQQTRRQERKPEKNRRTNNKSQRSKAADLVIFPELCLTGYVVRDQLYELAETIPGPSTKKVEAHCAKRRDAHCLRHARTERENESHNVQHSRLCRTKGSDREIPQNVFAHAQRF